MASWKLWLKAVGLAVWEKGVRALAGVVPFADVVLDIAERACANCGELQREESLKAAVQEVAQVAMAELKAEAAAIAQQASQGAPAGQVLANYLVQVPAAVRQALRRPADPSGTTLPPGFSLKRP